MFECCGVPGGDSLGALRLVGLLVGGALVCGAILDILVLLDSGAILSMQ